MTYAVEFHNVSRLYGDVRAVDGVSIAINDGEFFSMLGPSGSGKTTCLRLIAGFEQLSGGAITIFGKQASELPPWERDVNTVFQDYALFPQLQQSLGITFIFVTHDQGEALSMSDRVAVFNNGRIEQVDSPRELYMRPRTPFVASFVGTSNVFDETMSANVCGLQGMFSLRPEHIRLNDTSGEVQARGVIQAVQYQGAATRFELKLVGGEKLLVSQANLTGEMLPTTLSPGQQVMASWSRDVMVPLVEER